MIHRPRHKQVQLNLLVPRPRVPAWQGLPEDVREQAKKKLARLIREHRARLANGKEAGDE